jgi:polyisoprenoid-binding protein YceI
MIMSATMSQCKNCATLPQRTVELRNCMVTKLMLMHAACNTRALGIFAAALVLAGCAAQPHKAEPSPSPRAVAGHPAVGRQYEVVGSESLLIVRVYRGGRLARAGHNHIVASHNLAGTVYVTKDLAHSSFELEVPVAELTVDEAELRAAQGADFAADVPDSAKEGTRRNMLGAAVLDAEHYPEISLRCENLEMVGEGLTAQVEVRIRDQVRTFTAAVAYTLGPNELLAQGELPLKQTDLGLAPFTALLGALQVQDEMQLQFHIVARVQN